MPDHKTEDGIEFLKVGLQYIHLVKAVLGETVKQGNSHTVISPMIKGKEDNWDIYNNLTLWSDFNVIVPVLFNLYHGFETILKGFLVLDQKLLKPTHKLSGLLSEFKSIHPNSDLSIILDNYINHEKLPDIIKKFCSESKISIDEYYQALKYPESTSGRTYCHYPLKFQEELGIQLFRQIILDIDKITKSTVALGRSIS